MFTLAERVDIKEDVFDALSKAFVPNDTEILFSVTSDEAETFGWDVYGSRTTNETRNGVKLNNKELKDATLAFFGGDDNAAQIVLESFDIPCDSKPDSFDTECECFDILVRITTGYTWACNTRYFATNNAWSSKASIYLENFGLPYPKKQSLSPGGNSDLHCRDKGWLRSAKP